MDKQFKADDPEFQEFLDTLPVSSSMDDIRFYRQYASKCIEMGKEFETLSEWQEQNRELEPVTA